MARDFPKDTTSQLTWGFSAFGGLIHGAAGASVHLWANADTIDSGANDNRMFSMIQASASTGIVLNVDGSGTDRLRVDSRSQNSDSLQTAIATSTFTTGAWHSCGGVVDFTGDTITPYFNGVAEGSTAVTFGSSTYVQGSPSRRDCIGGNGVITATAIKFDGRIAEVGLWNAILTAEEMAALADGYSPLVVRPRNLVVWIPLIGRYTPEIIPQIGSGSAFFEGTGIVAAEHPRIIYMASRFWPDVVATAAPVVTTRPRKLLLGVGV